MSAKKPSQWALIVSTIGVVYGDIGTSPLYALKSCFSMFGLPANPVNTLGLISLFCWTLFLVVSIKYVAIVLKVTYRGEGGILALASLCANLKRCAYKMAPVVLGILGASLFFGDGVITPAISILGAFEGLNLISPKFSSHVVPLAILTLIFLFVFQKRGSGFIGQFFGPVMIVWFITIAAMGVFQIFQMPNSIKALNPYYALRFFYENGLVGALTLGGTILVVTGAEALYADLGHFGERPIRLSWNFFIFPCLLLNYIGQGALLLRHPAAVSNPFYFMAPEALLYPLIIVATAATIIASQSVISGVFSVSWQAIMLNYLPRLRVMHTSHHQVGQVYVPVINHLLCVLTIAAVLIFQSSDNLAVAYGLSISGVMLITTILVFWVAYYRWRWSLYKLLLLFAPLFALDVVFVSTNLIKIIEGAWFTILLTVMAAYTVRIWIQGNRSLSSQKFELDPSLKHYLEVHNQDFPQKIPGTAIFMTRSPGKVPNSLVFHLRHNCFLHRRMIFLSVLTTNMPRVSFQKKYAYTQVDSHTIAITVRYGFKEVPNLNKIFHWAVDQKIIKDPQKVSFFFSRGVPMTREKNAIKRFGKKLYILLCRNAVPAYEFYRIPLDKVIELGIRYEV